MGMIVSNAYMKRSFGKKLIESFLRRLDLTHVIDTSGVYLPGHGTPTTILFARHQPPVSSTIRAVRGIRGETVCRMIRQTLRSGVRLQTTSTNRDSKELALALQMLHEFHLTYTHGRLVAAAQLN